MKIRTLVMAVALTAIASAASAQVAGQSANATAPVKIKVLTPVSITRVGSTELNFGTVLRTGSPTSSIVVGTDGSRGAVVGMDSVTSTTSAAQFTVAGTSGENISVSSGVTGLPTGVNVTPNHGSNTRTLDGSGAATIDVGGTLAIESGTTVSGSLSGTLTVTVAYP